MLVPDAMVKLERDLFLGPDVVMISRSLLGKVLVSMVDGVRTSGVITETEAYAGSTDRASHAYGARRTARTEVMYARGGTGYVYLCYGIHHLFNAVTNLPGIPHAVLIRGIVPMDGLAKMRERRGRSLTTKGPGTTAQALGITTSLTGVDLCGDLIWLEDHGIVPDPSLVQVGPRIGVDHAGDDAALPYRSVYTYIV